MRRIALIVGLVAIAATGLFCLAPVARAEEAPVNVPLAYIPNLSNWGPTTAVGTASVWRIDAEVRLSVQGLPVLAQQVYGLWLVNPQAGRFLAVGRFNVGGDGTAQLDVSLPGSVPDGYSMVLITVQPDPEPKHSVPSALYSIAGSFQGNTTAKQQIQHLPDTGTHAQHPPFAQPAQPTPTPTLNLGEWLALLLGLLSLLFVALKTKKRRYDDPHVLRESSRPS